MALTEITDENFTSLTGSGKLALISFCAGWCNSSKMIGPVLNDLANEVKENILIGRVNVDASPGISKQFGISSVPALLFFKNGVEIYRQIGAAPKDVINAKLISLSKP
ncbi:thioredoxin [Mucilaginibacter gynuensis]|uniref:Thioredoxin n=1 Tax=Mucilaginibacter gynuensis TaxID=1302236 RepID=A0ABP8HA25_9SPHI